MEEITYIIRKPRVYFMENHESYYLYNNSLISEPANKKDIPNYNYFELFKGYECSLDGLKLFNENLIEWAYVLRKIYNIDYLKFYKHDDAVYNIFLNYSTNNIKKYIHQDGIEQSPAIKDIEFFMYEKCANSALMTINETIKNVKIQCYGYDCPSYYPHLLGSDLFDFKFPIREGKKSKMINLKKQLKYGIYECKITCDDSNFKKLFMFTKNNVYTHYSINFCLKYRAKFNIRIELLNLDNDSNCYVYEDCDLVKSSLVFGDWFNKLYKIKKEIPDNKLVKHLLSSLWGSLIKFNRSIIHDIDELNKLDISHINDVEENTQYKILEIYSRFDSELDDSVRSFSITDTTHPYKNNYRIKPFLTSYARKQFGDIIIQTVDNLDDVVRIHTDSVVLKKEYDFTKLNYYPVFEAKTSGLITWKNIMVNDVPKKTALK